MFMVSFVTLSFLVTVADSAKAYLRRRVTAQAVERSEAAVAA